MTISIKASDVKAPVAGLVGEALWAPHNRGLTLINKTPQAQKVATLTVGGVFSAGTVYTFELDGFELSYTSVSGDTNLAGVAVKIAALINADLRVRGKVSAEAASATVVVTCNWPGLDFTYDEDDANLSWALTTAAAEAGSVPFGRLVCSVDQTSDAGSLIGFLAVSTAFTAQVDSYVLTYVGGVNLECEVWINGEKYSAKHEMATDVDTSGAALVVAMNQILPSSVQASYVSGTDTFKVTAQLAGLAFESALNLGAGGGASRPVKSSNAGLATSVALAAKGISEHTYKEESAAYPKNAGVQTLSGGQIRVASLQAPGRGDAVYVELAAGDDAGKLFNSSSATRALLPASKCSWVRSKASDQTAVLEISF